MIETKAFVIAGLSQTHFLNSIDINVDGNIAIGVNCSSRDGKMGRSPHCRSQVSTHYLCIRYNCLSWLLLNLIISTTPLLAFFSLTGIFFWKPLSAVVAPPVILGDECLRPVMLPVIIFAAYWLLLVSFFGGWWNAMQVSKCKATLKWHRDSTHYWTDTWEKNKHCKWK